MNKETFLKIMGIVPFIIYVLVTQIWEMQYEIKITALIGVILIGFISVIFKNKERKENNRRQYLTLCLALIFMVLIFSFQYFNNLNGWCFYINKIR